MKRHPLWDYEELAQKSSILIMTSQKCHLEGAAVYDHSWHVMARCVHIGHYYCLYYALIEEILGTGMGK